jgi:hypothetical protein
LDIHRLLDGAFAGIQVTPDVQDLKEEMRGNLVARVAELEADGLSPGEAAHRAIVEVGDVRAIVDEMSSVATPRSAWHRNRVRPRPAYVLRTVIAALVGAAALAAVALLATGVLEPGTRPVLDHVAAVVVLVLAAALIVGDALRQETTTNYPVTRARATGYGLAAGLGSAGLGTAAGYVQPRVVAWLVVGALLAVASIVFFTYLGATQTNRHKPWVMREMARYHAASDGFEQDPVAAARFGIYTATIWIVSLAAFAALSLTVGWAFSWLALLAGLVVFLLTLARMLFPPGRGASVDTRPEQ